VLRYSRGDARHAFSLTGMGYSAEWNSTDQVPQRAVESGAVPRFGGLDDSLGGATARYSLSGDWQRASSHGLTRATAYGLRYRLNLFSNFTYFLDDPIHGDQFEQADRRAVVGGRITHRATSRVAGRPSELLVGADTRHDRIDTIGLYRTVRRVRDAVTREDAVRQTSAGVFAQHDLQWTPWLRSTIGLRADRFQFDVRAGNPLNSGRAADALVSPKAAAIIGPWKSTELYVNWGHGFHSNDARGATITVDPRTGQPAERVTPLVSARGQEIGIRSMAVRRLQTTLALWRLDLDSELLFIGDAGTTEAGRPSRRAGVEWSASYSLPRWVTVDADVSLSRARFRDADPAGDRIPGSVERVIAAGITLENAGPLFGTMRMRYFGARNLIEDASVRSAPTTLVNGQLGARMSTRAKLVLDVFNLLDRQVSDVDYFYASRLAGEPAPVEDLHFHPALPRSIRLAIQLGF
jgi:outer membrane receptor protein involved in Fe transport